MLDKWLALLPKGLVAFVSITLGVAFIVLSDPPKTVCDAQLDVFKKSQVGFLFPGKKAPQLPELVKFCKASNSAGGCYELFRHLKQMLQGLKAIPQECQAEAGELEIVRGITYSSLDLIVRLAWGEKPPAHVNVKFGWLDTSDMALFCDLKEAAIRYWGEGTWGSFRERYFQALPGANSLARDEAWQLMILSSNCNQFPR